MRVVEFGFWMPIETKVRVLIETVDTLASWIEWQGKGWDGCKSKSRSVAMPILAWHRNSCSSLDSGRAPSHAPHEHAFPVSSDRNHCENSAVAMVTNKNFRRLTCSRIFSLIFSNCSSLKAKAFSIFWMIFSSNSALLLWVAFRTSSTCFSLKI